MTDQEIVALANRVGKDLGRATFGEVCAHIDAADVAWGVWQGGGKTLIKGEGVLRSMGAGGVVEVTAIPVRSPVEALAIKRCWEVSKP